jgi:hypothetical protein
MHLLPAYPSQRVRCTDIGGGAWEIARASSRSDRNASIRLPSKIVVDALRDNCASRLKNAHGTAARQQKDSAISCGDFQTTSGSMS